MVCFTSQSLQRIREHAFTEAPKEACGILAGTAGKKVVGTVFTCFNVDKNPLSAYTIDPKELLDIITDIETTSEELELIGFYHTHPHSSPSPSMVDVERATWDSFYYVIYSISEDEFKCWKWKENQGRFVEEEFMII